MSLAEIARPVRPGLRNPLLLLTLSAIATKAAQPKASLPRLTGLDTLELTLALDVAERRGFTAQHGGAHLLTAAGLDWAGEELRPFAPLFAAAVRGAA